MDQRNIPLNDECSLTKTIIIGLLICILIGIGYLILKPSQNDPLTPPKLPSTPLKSPSTSPKSSSTPSSNNTWDYLMFSQQWPISACIFYVLRDRNKTENLCNFDYNKYDWTVHGIWPTRNVTKSPKYCTQNHFNLTDIKPIMDELNQHWLTVEKNDTEFWFLEYEWSKHGTCCLQIQDLNTTLKYFSQGLQWNKQYNISETLNKCEIYPNNSKIYTNTEVVTCIKKYFNANPKPRCVYDKIRKFQILTELRVCLDKNFNIRDCDIYGTKYPDCPKNFIYPATTETYTNSTI